MKAILLLLSLTVFAVTSRATSYTYTPNPVDLNDLDHHSAYTWRIDNINLGGATVTGASLTFTNIANWDTNPNILFIHLFDTAKNSGVRSFIDASGVPVPTNQMADNFASPLLASNPLIANRDSQYFFDQQIIYDDADYLHIQFHRGTAGCPAVLHCQWSQYCVRLGS